MARSETFPDTDEARLAPQMTRERRAGLLAALAVAAFALALSAVMTDGGTRITFIVGAVVCAGVVGALLGAQRRSPEEPDLG